MVLLAPTPRCTLDRDILVLIDLPQRVVDMISYALSYRSVTCVEYRRGSLLEWDEEGGRYDPPSSIPTVGVGSS